ncbi:MAG: lipocalin family protein [Hymenobacter sp.]
MEPLTYWTSPNPRRSTPPRGTYSARPGLRPDRGARWCPSQELGLRLFKVLNLYYWEGMCRVTGTHHGQPVTGNAYVEITNR